MDFGDVIFFLVFVGIIISNILKQLKKTKKQQSGPGQADNQPDKQPVKKSGWKNVLEQMLEEARKQMEDSAEPKSGGTPSKKPSGWEDLMAKSEPGQEKPYKREPERKVVKKPRQPGIHDAPVRKRLKYRTECMRCNASMKEITDLGTGRQKGLIYCDSCGEQHKYQILNGDLKLKQADEIRKKSVRAPERSYQTVAEESRAQRQLPVTKPKTDSLSAGGIKIPQQMSVADLRNAVVWSEILGKPLGLRDIEG